MSITFANTLLGSDNLALGRVPFGASWNGQPIIDLPAFIRAANATVWGRGDGPEEFSINVWRLFSTPAAALLFCGTHRAELPVQADLFLVSEDEIAAIRMADAVRSVTIAQRVGQSVLVQYRFIGSRFITDTAPTLVEPAADMIKRSSDEIDSLAEEIDIEYLTPFAGTPIVVATLSVPDGGDVITARVKKSSETAAGFTVLFSAPIPTSGYYLSWVAVG